MATHVHKCVYFEVGSIIICNMVSGRQRFCKECEDNFEVSRDWQIFCSANCRMRYNKRYRETCFYCGQYGNHREHVNPQSFSDKHWFSHIEYVFACAECNVALSSRLLMLDGRLKFLIDYYTNKFSLNKPVIGWGEDEIHELGPSLRRRIKKGLTMRRAAEDRVVYLNYMLNMDKSLV